MSTSQPMSLEQILRARSVGQSLTPINLTQKLPDLVAFMNNTAGDPGGSQGIVNAFLATFDIKSLTPKALPQTTGDFFTDYFSYLKGRGITPSNSDPITALALSYSAAVNNTDAVDEFGGPDLEDNDWIHLNASPNEMRKQAIAWFTQFLQNYDYLRDGTVGDIETFFGKAGGQLTTTVAINFDRTLYKHNRLGEFTPITDADQKTLSFEGVYKQLFPKGNFTRAMKSFYEDQLEQFGFFIPSQAFPAFISAMIDERIVESQKATGSILDTTSLSSAAFNETAILNRIFALLGEMLESIQRVTIAQAARLFIYTSWQRAYTNLLGQIPNFLQSGTPTTYLTDKTTGESFAKDKAQQRGDLNSFNGNLREVIQNSRTVIGDTAQSLQANLNQSTDAQTQEANMATAFIQELSTILSAIYR